MNSQLIIRNIGRFLLLMLLQVLVFNNIYLGGYINPCIYLLFIAEQCAQLIIRHVLPPSFGFSSPIR